MRETFDADRLLSSLPHRHIAELGTSVVAPKVRAVGKLSDYNGFSGKERLRTFEVAKWLNKVGAMQHSGLCNLCNKTCDQQHAEDYYTLSTWIDMCRSCHTRLHQRFRHSAQWQRYLDALNLTDGHWARMISSEPFDLALLLRTRGATEPVFENFISR